MTTLTPSQTRRHQILNRSYAGRQVRSKKLYGRGPATRFLTGSIEGLGLYPGFDLPCWRTGITLVVRCPDGGTWFPNLNEIEFIPA